MYIQCVLVMLLIVFARIRLFDDCFVYGRIFIVVYSYVFVMIQLKSIIVCVYLCCVKTDGFV